MRESPSGKAVAFQATIRGFESRLPLLRASFFHGLLFCYPRVPREALPTQEGAKGDNIRIPSPAPESKLFPWLALFIGLWVFYLPYFQAQLWEEKEMPKRIDPGGRPGIGSGIGRQPG